MLAFLVGVGSGLEHNCFSIYCTLWRKRADKIASDHSFFGLMVDDLFAGLPYEFLGHIVPIGVWELCKRY